jgi:hypothetical protein
VLGNEPADYVFSPQRQEYLRNPSGLLSNTYQRLSPLKVKRQVCEAGHLHPSSAQRQLLTIGLSCGNVIVSCFFY